MSTPKSRINLMRVNSSQKKKSNVKLISSLHRKVPEEQIGEERIKNSILYLTLLCYTEFKGVRCMASTWFCLECYKDMGDSQYCPHCGAHRLGDMAMSQKETESVLAKFFGRKPKGEKQPMFSKEESFLYGIHPNDEMYRKTMELDILSKNYRE